MHLDREEPDEQIDQNNLARLAAAGIEPNEDGKFNFSDAVRLDPDMTDEEKEILLASCEDVTRKFR